MNIEAPTSAKTTETASTSTSAATAAATSTTKDDSTSFKSQLDAVKTKDATTQKNSEDATNAADTAQTQKTAEETAKNNISQQVGENKLTDGKLVDGKVVDNKSTKEKNTEKTSEVTDPIAELSSRIATLSELKTGISKTQGVTSKTKETTSTTEIGQTIKMDNKDVSFFLNLVQNQQMSAQAAQGSTSNSALTGFTDIKSEATQQTVQVSSTLLDAMNEASKTGKSFRIDFDSDVAVIMKVDKNGTISANFIPGDAAVENYLRNNIAGLRQNFENQGLAYNEISYSKQQKQEQQEQQKRKNDKENENE